MKCFQFGLPNLEELTLHLHTFKVRQDELVMTLKQEVKTVTRTMTLRHKPLKIFTQEVTEERSSEIWQEHENFMCLLGLFPRLEKVDLHTQDDKVPGVLYPSNFAFLRAGNNVHHAHKTGLLSTATEFEGPSHRPDRVWQGA